MFRFDEIIPLNIERFHFRHISELYGAFYGDAIRKTIKDGENFIAILRVIHAKSEICEIFHHS